MSKEVEFYEKNTVDLKTRFYRYMDSLVTHKSISKIESLLYIIIHYTQLISGFFSEQVNLMDNKLMPDNYLSQLQTIIRIRDLFKSSFHTYELIMYFLFIIIIILSLLFAYRMYYTGKTILCTLFLYNICTCAITVCIVFLFSIHDMSFIHTSNS